eukprot:6174-Heterococcus_DN1.PRE.1
MLTAAPITFNFEAHHNGANVHYRKPQKQFVHAYSCLSEADCIYYAVIGLPVCYFMHSSEYSAAEYCLNVRLRDQALISVHEAQQGDVAVGSSFSQAQPLPPQHRLPVHSK